MVKDWFDDFYDLLFNYRKGLLRISRQRNIWNGLLIYLLVNLIVSLATFNMAAVRKENLLFHPGIADFFPRELQTVALPFFPLATILFQLVFGPLYFLLLVAILNLVVELFGGRPGVVRLGAVLGYGQYPYLIVALGGVFVRYTDLNILGFLAFISFLWSLFLKVAGLKIVADFSWGRATLAYFMPLLVLMAAILLFVLLAIVFLLPLIVPLMEHFQASLLF